MLPIRGVVDEGKRRLSSHRVQNIGKHAIELGKLPLDFEADREVIEARSQPQVFRSHRRLLHRSFLEDLIVERAPIDMGKAYNTPPGDLPLERSGRTK